MLVDSHCHLHLMDPKQYDGAGTDAHVRNAAEHGVEAMLCVSIELRRLESMLALIRPYENVYASAGVHPNDSGEGEPSVEGIVEAASRPEIVAVGESGLDYYRSQGELDWQRERFRRHIEAAKQVGKPLIVHSRAARDDTLRVLEEEDAHEIGGVMHCFVEDWDAAQQAIEMGFYISFSGIVTFQNARELKEVARQVPLEWLLVETDCPYLAPVPYRGKPNQPAYVRYVADHIAELRDIPIEDVERATTDNFYRLFSTAPRP